MAAKMLCGGCGAKVGASVLSRVLEQLRHGLDGELEPLAALPALDDAAVLEPPPAGHVMVRLLQVFGI